MTTETEIAAQERAIDAWMADEGAEEVAPPQGDFPTNKGQAIAKSITSAGERFAIGAKVGEVDKGRWVKAYNTKTGASFPINIVHRQFWSIDNPRAWRWPDGTLQVSLTPPPGITPFKGVVLCFLHPAHPLRSYYDSIGLQGRYCKTGDSVGGKSNIPSVVEAIWHAENRHQREWKQALAAEQRLEREQDRESQRKRDETLTSIMSLALERGATIPEAVPAAVAEVAVEAPTPEAPKVAAKPRGGPPVTLTCEVEECGAIIEGKAKVGALSKMRSHMKKEHSDA